jgi:predicted nucleic acid-binding protein
VTLVVDASVALKWVLDEPDSHLADTLLLSGEDLLIPDFLLGEATNVLWLQVRRKLMTPGEAREGLSLLRSQIQPIRTADLSLHDVALQFGLALNRTPYDTLYLAFAIAVGAAAVVTADDPFARGTQSQWNSSLSDMLVPWRMGKHARPPSEIAILLCPVSSNCYRVRHRVE